MEVTQGFKPSLALKLTQLLINLLWYGCLVVIALLLLAWPISMLFEMFGGTFIYNFSSHLDLPTLFRDSNIPLPQFSTEVPFNAIGFKELSVEVKGLWFFVLIANSFFVLASITAIVYLLKRFFKTLKSGTPFLLENVRRVRWIAFLIWIIGFTQWMVPVLFILTHLTELSAENNLLSLNPPYIDFPWIYLFVGFIVLAISQIFDYGCRLQQDQDLTI